VRSHCIKVGELRFNLGNADGTVWECSGSSRSQRQLHPTLMSMQGFKAGILNALALKRHQVTG